MPVVAAIAAFKASGKFKALLSQGDKLLADLTGCKVKPKGTVHEEVYAKMPKFFFRYGTGLSGSKGSTAAADGGIFDLLSGLWIRDLEAAFPKEERKRMEQSARHKCETLTGDWSYFTETRAPVVFKGVVRLSDGELYDAAMYGVQGGSYTQPLDARAIKPKGNVENVDNPGAPTVVNPGSGDMLGGLLKLAGGYLAYKTFAG